MDINGCQNTMLNKQRDPVSWKWQIGALKWHLWRLISCCYFWLLFYLLWSFGPFFIELKYNVLYFVFDKKAMPCSHSRSNQCIKWSQMVCVMGSHASLIIQCITNCWIVVFSKWSALFLAFSTSYTRKVHEKVWPLSSQKASRSSLQ